MNHAIEFTCNLYTHTIFSSLGFPQIFPKLALVEGWADRLLFSFLGKLVPRPSKTISESVAPGKPYAGNVWSILESLISWPQHDI